MRRPNALAAVALLGLLAACAAGPDGAAHTLSSHGSIAGFWLGLWHGLICPITFLVSLFSRHVGIYEIHNDGGWYDFGFVLGVSLIFRGSGAGKWAARKKAGRALTAA